MVASCQVAIRDKTAAQGQGAWLAQEGLCLDFSAKWEATKSASDQTLPMLFKLFAQMHTDGRLCHQHQHHGHLHSTPISSDLRPVMVKHKLFQTKRKNVSGISATRARWTVKLPASLPSLHAKLANETRQDLYQPDLSWHGGQNAMSSFAPHKVSYINLHRPSIYQLFYN